MMLLLMAPGYLALSHSTAAYGIQQLERGVCD